MSSEWIEWKGGDCPCGPGAVVEWQTRAMPGHMDHFGPAQADLLDWRRNGYGDDIVAFRVVGQVKLHGHGQDPDPAKEPALVAGVDKTLRDRDGTHGDYYDTARIAQALKHVIKVNAKRELEPDMQESLDMIASKIARILSGNPNEPDHWHDIAGYALARLELAIRRMDVP